MKRNVTILILTVIILVFCGLIVFYVTKPNKEVESDNFFTKIPDSEILPLLEEIQKKGRTFMSSDGISVILPFENQEFEAYLLIELQKKDMGGKIAPLKGERLQFINLKGNRSIASNPNGTDRLCLGLSYQPYTRSLIIGNEYKVDLWTKNEFGVGIRENISQIIKIPENVEEGKFYRLQLIMKDEQQEKKGALLKEQQIISRRINISLDIPDKAKAKAWACLYKSEKLSSEVSIKEQLKTATFENIEILGGDILLFYINDNNEYRPWAYIYHIDKRDLKIPQDADMVISEKDFIDVQLTARDLAFLGDSDGLGFFLKEDSFLPIIFPGRSGFKQTDDESAVYSCETKVPLGKFYVFTCSGNMKKDNYLGTIVFDSEKKQYFLDSLFSAK